MTRRIEIHLVYHLGNRSKIKNDIDRFASIGWALTTSVFSSMKMLDRISSHYSTKEYIGQRCSHCPSSLRRYAFTRIPR